MCGIIGCVGADDTKSVLIDGLRKESYRGYDSSGICVLAPHPVVVKAVGHLDQLEKKLSAESLPAKIGIGHNRWATHGKVSQANAHPHADCRQQIFLVHNGIIENYAELKQKLVSQGHTFVSQTDSEVLAHLIEQFYSGSLEDAVRSALLLVKGTYGLVVISSHEPDKLIAARMSSPLVVAIDGTRGYVASDPAALASQSDKMVFLEDGEIAVVTAGAYHVTDLRSRIKHKTLTKLDFSAQESDLGDYDHYMAKEIFEQPVSLRNTLRGRILVDQAEVRLGGLVYVSDRLRKINQLNIIACGTAYYAGLVGEYMLEEFAGIPTEVHIASEFRYRDPIINDQTASLFISQSGETADTLAALEEVKRKGGLTLGLVNAVGSSIARATDAGVYNHAGPEIGVASTKAFTSQLTLLAMLSVLLGRLPAGQAGQRNLSQAEAHEIVAHLETLPEQVEQILSQAEEVKKLAEKISAAKNVLFVGRKYNYPIALEGALKLKEVSYIHAEGYPSGELKHGAIALIDKATPTVAICPQDSVYDKNLSNLEEIKSRSGPVTAIATEGDDYIKSITKDVIYIPKTIEMLTPILAVLPLQLLAYHAGLERGLNVDKPRNLAKSVTVE